MPATKSLRSGTWARTLLPTIEVGLPALGDAASRRARVAEELDERRDAAFAAASATFAAGSMPSTGTPRCDEVLQQVAVVAGELDDEAVRRRARSGSIIASA